MCSFLPWLKPGVPFGTMKFEISLRPSGRIPVTAAMTIGPVISEPELLMKVLAPLMTQQPSFSTARVWILAASEPAFGSVRPMQPTCVPVRIGRRNRAFWPSVP
ncbi:hypothetical protein D3C72_2215360 [compost metagenome]